MKLESAKFRFTRPGKSSLWVIFDHNPKGKRRVEVWPVAGGISLTWVHRLGVRPHSYNPNRTNAIRFARRWEKETTGKKK